MHKEIEKVWAIAKSNAKGFTYDLKSGVFVESGFVVAYRFTQNTHDKEGLRVVIRHAQKHNNIVGGWFNTSNKKYYFDSVVVFKNLQKALEFAKKNKQIAIFDLDKMKEIKVKYNS